MPGPVPPSTWSVQEALRWASDRLAETAEAVLAAKMLLAHVLRCTVTDLFIHPERTLTAKERRTYQSLIARRARHEPVAYLIGHRAFWDLELLVDSRVLIPRPETEELVEQAVAVAQRWPRPRLVDVGTGNGAIAVSLAVHLPLAQVFAIDRSAETLRVAHLNAHRYDVCERIVFLTGDLLAPLRTLAGHSHLRMQVIVANLPYVSEAEYAALPPEIRVYEPREALVSGADGLDAIRALLDTARPHLTADGVILLEIGAWQGEAVSKLAARAFPCAQIAVIPDYAHIDRIVRIEMSA